MLMLFKLGFAICIDQIVDALTQPLALSLRFVASAFLWAFIIHELLR